MRFSMASIAAVWATLLAPISSCKASISSEHPQVGDGELSGPGTAAAPTLLTTQKAESNLSRRAPLSSATFFGCECLACDMRGEKRFCARREGRAE